MAETLRYEKRSLLKEGEALLQRRLTGGIFKEEQLVY